MPGNRRKPAERAILLAGLVGGLTLEQVNELLTSTGFTSVPMASWEMLNRAYLPAFQKDPKLLGESIYKPRKMGDL